MIRIGLTGPSGAGKGLFSSLLRAYGIKSIDTDRVYHDLLVPPSPCLDALVAAFGDGILNPDGTLCRPRLASIVFSSEIDADEHERRLALLNAITHRFVIEKTEAIVRTLEEAGERAVVIDAPALFEAGMDRSCSLVVAVIAAPDTRVERIVARDSISRDRAEARVHGQHPDAFYTERADAVLTNDGDPEAFRADVDAFMRNFLPALLKEEREDGDPL